MKLNFQEIEKIIVSHDDSVLNGDPYTMSIVKKNNDELFFIGRANVLKATSLLTSLMPDVACEIRQIIKEENLFYNCYTVYQASRKQSSHSVISERFIYPEMKFFNTLGSNEVQIIIKIYITENPIIRIQNDAWKFIAKNKWASSEVLFINNELKPDEHGACWYSAEFVVGADHVLHKNLDWFSDVEKLLNFVQQLSIPLGWESAVAVSFLSTPKQYKIIDYLYDISPRDNIRKSIFSVIMEYKEKRQLKAIHFLDRLVLWIWRIKCILFNVLFHLFLKEKLIVWFHGHSERQHGHWRRTANANLLLVAGNKVLVFPYPIHIVKEIFKTIIVILDIPPKAIFPRNVFGYILAENRLWQIDQYTLDELKSNVRIVAAPVFEYATGQILLQTQQHVFLHVDCNSGQILGRVWCNPSGVNIHPEDDDGQNKECHQ